jgi:hypothetical protein
MFHGTLFHGETIKSNSMKYLLIIILLCVLSGCADVENVEKCTIGHTYGFWGGLWHGLIAPISFIGSLFSNNIAVWANNNNGAWYSFGFLLGVGGFSVGASKTSIKVNN